MVRLYRAKLVASTLILPIAIIGSIFHAPVLGAETRVGAVVCNMSQPSTASLVITKPETGLVFEQSVIDVEGTISDLTQIQVQLNNQYSMTIPINAGQTTFTTTVSLPKGTHVVRMIGVDICQIQNPSDEFVATYEPAVVENPNPPETIPPGGGTERETPGANPTSPGIVDPPLRGLDEFVKKIEDTGYEALVTLDIARPDTSEDVPFMIARSMAVTTGSVAVIWPQLVSIAQHHWRKIKLWRVRSRTGQVGLFLVGLGLILLALIS